MYSINRTRTSTSKEPPSQSHLEIMGIVNLTPDSFSDGGKNQEISKALKTIQTHIEEGADIIDLGAESTRPGSKPVCVEEEWSRLKPLLQDIYSQNTLPDHVQLSIDTYKPEIMIRSLSLGAQVINNVKGLAPHKVLKILGENKTRYISMYGHQNPQIMQESPLTSKEALEGFLEHCNKSQETLVRFGFKEDHIFLDPGIGFGKSFGANLALIKSTTALSKKHNLLLGVSRKSFLKRITGVDTPSQRDPASKTLEMSLAFMGAKIIRTHQVKPLNEIRGALEARQ